MEANGVNTVQDARRIIEERELDYVKVGVFDLDGVLRGKYLSCKKFLSALESGFGFCDVIFGWDSNDQLYDNVEFTGWHTGFPDATVRLLPETCRELPYEDGGLFFLGEFESPADKLCPRGVLRRVIQRAKSHGFEPYSALEYEFFVFDETPHSVREKRFHDLKPLTPGNFGYSVLRSSAYSDFHRELLDVCMEMDLELECLHTETGAGVLEAAILVDETLASADKAALFKTFSKVVAQHNNLLATFMAKWSPLYPGQSGHVHISLREKGGAAFHDPDNEHNMSKTMRHFVAGCQMLMPEMLVMVAPTINSYTRLIPGFWAPTNATWGIDNRTVALRVIPGSAKSQRIEYRIAAADGNPYLVLAAALASGLYGIENELEPATEPCQGNAYEVKMSEELTLPATLWEAAQLFKASEVAREMFGNEFVDHYAATREWEEREYRKHITDWELQRYFEII